MTVQDFANSSLVSIEQLEDSNDYGHYPFSLYAETETGKIEINSLMLGGDVLACYNRIKTYVDNNAKRVYMSVDFPAAGKIKHDFIAIFSVENNESNLFVIPYNIETGEKYDIIDSDPVLDIIMEQFKVALNV